MMAAPHDAAGELPLNERGLAGSALPREQPLHASLVRSILYFGVERQVIAVEATLVAALLFGVGPHLATVAVAAVVLLVVHPAMVWLTARDPQVTEVFLRSRGYADYYAPHPAVPARARPPRVRPSVPRAR
jgi:type IV secretion system protein VirB3